MPSPAVHTVRFEPVGVEMEVEEGETVLDAAFRQGISVMHGCKEGQCRSCKSLLLDGDIELKKYSTFALPDYESETSHILLCRTLRLQRPDRRASELRRRPDEPLDRRQGIRCAGRQRSRADARHPPARSRARKAAAFLGRPVCRSDDSGRGHHALVLDGNRAQRPNDAAFHHQEISRWRVLVAARRRPEARRQACRQGTVRHVFPPRGAARADDAGRRRLGHVAAVVDPQRSRRRAAKQRPVRFFYGARTPLAICSISTSSRPSPSKLAGLPLHSGAVACRSPATTGRARPASSTKSWAAPCARKRFAGEIDAYTCGPPPMIDAVMPVLQMAGSSRSGLLRQVHPGGTMMERRNKPKATYDDNQEDRGGYHEHVKSQTAPLKSGAAGAAQFAGWDSRKYNYFEPKGRKATPLRRHDRRCAAGPEALSAAGLDHLIRRRHADLFRRLGPPPKARTGTSSAPSIRSGSAPIISASRRSVGMITERDR